MIHIFLRLGVFSDPRRVLGVFGVCSLCWVVCLVCSLSSLVFLGGFNVQVYKNFGRYIYIFLGLCCRQKEGKILEDSGA